MATAQEITAEIARLRDRLRIARNGLADLNPNLQSNQAILARYRDEVANIPGQILALEAELKSGQEHKLELSEIGQRAIAIRDWNHKRIALKNIMADKLGQGYIHEIKQEHLSE